MISFLRTDVTAVCLFDDFIFAGMGSNVYTFNKNTCAFIEKLHVLNGQKVHGIVPKTDGTTIVYGGKQMCIMVPIGACSPSQLIAKKSDAISCDDWILHAAWVKDDTVAALTAHNVVQVWNINTRELIAQHVSKDNSILYSGLLHLLQDDILVFAGTVFSKVIVHRCKRTHHLQILEGHKGVIFSIAWEATMQLIVTTSDDRSVKIWGQNTKTEYSPNCKDYWEQCDMVCRHTVFGHLSRVMRCSITPRAIVSVGEDSNVCFWDFSGRLLRKVKAHQNGCIWAVSSDATHVVTGGADAGIVLHPLAMVEDHCQKDILKVEENFGAPKKLIFMARGNIVAYFANDHLMYYNVELDVWKFITAYDTTYKMMDLSSCRQMFAIIDVDGNLDVFAESCKNSPDLQKIMHRKLNLSRVCSMQWAGNRLLAVCSNGGTVTVVASDCENLSSFCLPACKERWLTAATVNPHRKIFVFGDRCGNVHFYRHGQTSPLKTFRKIHGPYGPTTITWRNDHVVTTGRDGTVKHFSVRHLTDELQIKMMHQTNLPFQWIERFIREDGLVCGFNERNFIVHDLTECRTIVDVACGGGHRAWDIYRYYQKLDGQFEECLQFVYVKDSSIHRATFQLDHKTSKTVIRGSHIKEINCLAIIPLEIDSYNGFKMKETFFIAGGEDTTIRISSCKPKNCNQEFTDRLIFKQLSSIRTIAYYSLNKGQILLVSGGGRANICIKVVHFIKSHSSTHFDLEAESIAEYQAKALDKDRGSKNDVDLDPETRIMSLQIIELVQNHFIILAGCSDSILRIFKYLHEQDNKFKTYTQINYHKTCILKVHYMKAMQHQVAFTTTTTGEVALWDLSVLLKEIDVEKLDLSGMEPIFKFNVNKSGINSFAVNCTEFNCNWLVATGGDDASVHLILLRLQSTNDISSVFEVCRLSREWHCAQVTGLQFVDDYLISASIDQRITVSRYSINGDVVRWEFVKQFYTDVADVQGLVVESREGDAVTICVYGKGIETMSIRIPKD